MTKTKKANKEKVKSHMYKSFFIFNLFLISLLFIGSVYGEISKETEITQIKGYDVETQIYFNEGQTIDTKDVYISKDVISLNSYSYEKLQPKYTETLKCNYVFNNKTKSEEEICETIKEPVKIADLKFECDINGGYYNLLYVDDFTNDKDFIKNNGVSKGISQCRDNIIYFSVYSFSSYTIDLTTGALSYYTFDETSGNVSDTLEYRHLTQMGTISNQTGLINGARGAFSTSNYLLNTEGIHNNSKTISLWIYPTSSTPSGTIFSTSRDLSNTNCFMRFYIGSGNLYMYGASSSGCGSQAIIGQVYNHSTVINVNEWNHLALVKNDSTVLFYWNGVNVHNITTTAWFDYYTSPQTISFGAHRRTSSQIYDALTNAYLDEIYISEKVFTPTDMLSLYDEQKDGLTSGQYPFDSIKLLLESQTPATLNYFNILSPVILNYTVLNNNKSNDVYLNYTLNTTLPCIIYTNGVCDVLPNTYYTLLPYNITNNTHLFSIYSENITPVSYIIDNDYILSTPKTFEEITKPTNAFKIKVQNISTDADILFLEGYLNYTNTINDDVNVYMCNSSYTTGNFLTSPFCSLVGEFSNIGIYNHTHTDYSMHNLLVVDINNSKFNNINLTSTVYVILQSAEPFKIGVVNNNTGSFETTGNRGVTWTSKTTTPDFHIHQFKGDEELIYSICGIENKTQSLVCSNQVKSVLNPVLPSEIPVISIITPENNATYYNTDIINLQWNAFSFNSIEQISLLVNGQTFLYNSPLTDYNLSLFQYTDNVTIKVIINNTLFTNDDEVFINILINESLTTGGGTTMLFNWSSDSNLLIGTCPTTPHSLFNLWVTIIILIVLGLYASTNGNKGLGYLSGFGLIFSTLFVWGCSWLIGGLIAILGIAFLLITNSMGE